MREVHEEGCVTIQHASTHAHHSPCRRADEAVGASLRRRVQVPDAQTPDTILPPPGPQAAPVLRAQRG